MGKWTASQFGVSKNGVSNISGTDYNRSNNSTDTASTKSGQTSWNNSSATQSGQTQMGNSRSTKS
ncbi:hypothetical protein [Paenibacillus sp. NEAU-GSW1]|uniref:hypothetical protein n=1 Tax=Paenibacillus sp. NEAU-GSW1 TaxID=2682486 RepID=UPI0012E1CED2|nr:hypothetical protein [Paenibacillus sp. NEAU-GSW1]MUT66017.1 hypothetical protein [Paenibacillus sp. NEAU-GSW1]